MTLAAHWQSHKNYQHVNASPTNYSNHGPAIGQLFSGMCRRELCVRSLALGFERNAI